ncbi:WD repeat-containing protein 93 isoform X2 [Brienomyrus brachyistius]|uniref:WD repeat-containing protein 93 isoform X2 n=1 Tax=Brienomyrus brachyistius TaxID=42636 RepID=UPI0020B260AC|nr:WD repeat-containing protein 93 isoform X2 [Brienomyrus brachyistius]
MSTMKPRKLGGAKKDPKGIPEPWDSEDSADEERVPDLLHDSLPQPFRMIGKVLEGVLDAAWGVISEKEAARVAEQTRRKIPQVEFSDEIKLPVKANCLACTDDGKYVFVGFSCGISAITAVGHVRTATWEQGRVEIISIHCTCLGEMAYLIATVDDMGVSRVFAYYADYIYLMKLINETKEINQRNNCTKIELSEGGNYAAVMMECNGDSWIEMNRFPKVSWLKELEGLHAASGNQVTNTSGTEVAKFSPVVTVLKIKTPDMLSGTSLKCPFEVLQKTACSSVIGSGQNHMISSQQWAEQRALYKLVHSKYLGTGTCEMEARARLGSLYFLLPGGLSTVTDGTRSLQGPPSAVYVWWRGDHNLYQYLLHTRAKEKTDDEAKPSEVWSNAQEIVCSAISRCTRHIALGLMGGLVAMWDRRLGLPWSVLSVPADSPFSKLHFLDCLPFPQDPFLPKMHFLVTCKNGDCRVITAGRGMDSQVTRLCGRPGDAEAPPTEVLSVHFLQMLVLLMYRNGTIVLLDTSDDIVVASLVLPPNHCLATPWSPVYTLDPVNQNLFVRGR